MIGIIIGKHRNGQSVDKIQLIPTGTSSMRLLKAIFFIWKKTKKKPMPGSKPSVRKSHLRGGKYGFIRTITQPANSVNSETNSLHTMTDPCIQSQFYKQIKHIETQRSKRYNDNNKELHLFSSRLIKAVVKHHAKGSLSKNENSVRRCFA